MMFSITIPAYKSRFLRDAISSVLCQSYNDFELIIVDDCSPEDLWTIVSEFDDPRLHYFRNSNNCGAENVVDNWNICLSHSTGDFVICMGDDDMLSPDALEEYAKYISRYPDVNVFHARVKQIDSAGKEIRTLSPRKEYESVFSFMFSRWSGYNIYIGDFCYRTESLIANGGYFKLPLAWGSDDITAFREAGSHGIVNVQAPTFLYRINGETISSTGNVRIKMAAYQSQKFWCSDFLEKSSPVLPEEADEKQRCMDILEDSFANRMRWELIQTSDCSLKAIVSNCCLAREYGACPRLLIKQYISLLANKVKSKR